MTRPRNRRNRRAPYLLAAAAAAALLVVLALAAWFCIDALLAPGDVVRVLYAETANASHEERLLVAGVMKNRVGNPAFGDGSALQDVVRQPGAFSSLGSGDNVNWRRSRHPGQMTTAERAAWADCLAIVDGTIPPALGPSGRPLVYYHDKSINKPARWDNAQWRAVREKTTAHFIFYSIVPARP